MVMPVVHQFAYGSINPIVSFFMALVGAVFGLVCTARARLAGTRHRVRWLLFAGVALGGVGIWMMHFMAMLGFDVSGEQVRYSVPLTALSAIVAIVVVTAGLLFVGLGRPSVIKVLIGGVLTGLGVAGMHYIGMAALQVDGHVGYQPRLVVASILIAVVASTVALWFTVVAKTVLPIAAASVIFAAAVCSMHYTGMAAVRVTPSSTAGQPSGVDPINLVVPIIIVSIIALLAMLFASMNMMTADGQGNPVIATTTHMSMSVAWDDVTVQRTPMPRAPNPPDYTYDGRHQA